MEKTLPNRKVFFLDFWIKKKCDKSLTATPGFCGDVRLGASGVICVMMGQDRNLAPQLEVSLDQLSRSWKINAQMYIAWVWFQSRRSHLALTSSGIDWSSACAKTVSFLNPFETIEGQSSGHTLLRNCSSTWLKFSLTYLAFRTLKERHSNCVFPTTIRILTPQQWLFWGPTQTPLPFFWSKPPPLEGPLILTVKM